MKSDKLVWIILLSTCALAIILMATFIIIFFVALFKYGNTPVTELPAWAYMIFGGRE